MARLKPRKSTLKAKQIMPFQTDEGSQGLMMIDSYGDIYLCSTDGWVAFNMEVANVNPTI